MNFRFIVRVPATSANLGPGFDCLGLALDLWNQVTISLGEKGFQVDIQGYGSQSLARDERNLVVRAILNFYQAIQREPPSGLSILCENHIPDSSGLGSSAAAVLAGLLAANTLEGEVLLDAEILQLAYQMEGHGDNVAAALLGGLVVTVDTGQGLETRRYEPFPYKIAVVIPRIDFPTAAARAALPEVVALKDAIFNLGRTPLVVEGLRTGDLNLLRKVMEDRLHEPFRLRLIPGAQQALQRARQTGAVAAALSGAGPALIAFTLDEAEDVGQVMKQAFLDWGRIEAVILSLKPTCLGAQVSHLTP